jgi:hypothetical protein
VSAAFAQPDNRRLDLASRYVGRVGVRYFAGGREGTGRERLDCNFTEMTGESRVLQERELLLSPQTRTSLGPPRSGKRGSRAPALGAGRSGRPAFRARRVATVALPDTRAAVVAGVMDR